MFSPRCTDDRCDHQTLVAALYTAPIAVHSYVRSGRGRSIVQRRLVSVPTAPPFDIPQLHFHRCPEIVIESLQTTTSRNVMALDCNNSPVIFNVGASISTRRCQLYNMLFSMQ
uniref:Uncharacterized protein n=1 Tax=Spongospora subterranea TaxID=70186 RepID=A0A0H5QRT6_9EUKA|eukprot:CRZ04256.1 hypothetical protein [Spongospora subterranea]